ncbi:MAG TPA: hypothetical protein VIH99_04510 [Bdellovibrionota bacterium]
MKHGKMKVIGKRSLHGLAILALLFFVGSGCGKKDKESRQMLEEAKKEFKELKKENEKMKEDFQRVTGCLAKADSDSARAECK